ncbi:MAG: heat shock protein DnaJ domain protein [Marmoricola sp.]|jgi:Mce-associated membrane protein|nr:heat shock protein DnaJ domain protein [Marmoricola sp.]
MTTSPTWYDVLGVSRDATPEEIKAAWRASTDRFEPGSGSGQFRMFNEAADVLLDPDRRAAYDVSLADDARTAPTVSLSEGHRPAGEEAPPPAPVFAGAEDVERPGRRVPRRRSRSAGPQATVDIRRAASRRAVLLTSLLAVLTVAALVAAAFLGLKVRTDARVAAARDEAPAAAERAAKAILSYDYRTLPADRSRASAYLTPAFRTKYLKNFTLLEKQKDGTPGAAIQTKTAVTSSVLGSGVMDAEDGVARVLVYVNQVSTRPGKDPQIFQNRVAMTMEKDGNRWLVADLKSY